MAGGRELSLYLMADSDEIHAVPQLPDMDCTIANARFLVDCRQDSVVHRPPDDVAFQSSSILGMHCDQLLYKTIPLIEFVVIYLLELHPDAEREPSHKGPRGFLDLNPTAIASKIEQI